MNQTPTENFVIFVALLLLYVQTSAQHYIAADGLGGESPNGRVLYAEIGSSAYHALAEAYIGRLFPDLKVQCFSGL